MERARQHIQAAARLSQELGGTDKDVKAYFFALGRQRLNPIFDEYQRLYGRPAREYAELTCSATIWMTGARQSG
ncbi:MAG TPA: hypothetical protein VFG23_20335 [Polyangia bacterium]|nr:hypothetical protein [Polyangia bacterium]